MLRIYETEVLERQATHLIGTLGHVSEGKSTLIRALTGIKTQRHQKEKERNITIHLGYANCKIYQHTTTGDIRAGTSPNPDEVLIAHLSFVDCPGHEAFLATMLGGASIMDTACLIIAADKDTIPQPQTHEHLIAAHLMGLPHIAVIQNKIDLIPKDSALVNHEKIQKFIADTTAEKDPLFPISAQHGWGVHHVLNYLSSLPPPPRNLDKPARLTCVRSFDINKPGPWTPGSTLSGGVIGGTLQQGVLAVGDWIEIRPGVLKRGAAGQILALPISTRIRGIRCEKEELPYAVPGSLIALATDLDPGLTIANGMVGQRIGAPGTLPPIVGEILVRFHSLKRDEHTFSKHKVGHRVRLCSNVMTVEGTIVEMEKKTRRIRLDRPLCLEVGESVGILRQHDVAGRELLEGSGEVRETVAWPDVEEAPCVPRTERTIEWIPMQKPDFSVRPTPSYSDLLDEVLAQKEDVLGSAGPMRLKLKEPQLERIPKNTVWLNWKETTDILETGMELTYKEHLQSYLDSELMTSSSINISNQLIVKGKWKLEELRNLLRKYVSIYKRCSQCHGYDTGLIKEGRVIKVRCRRCVSDNAIAHE